MKEKFLNIGWTSKVMQKRSTFSISINRIVAVGSNLSKGQILHCYLAEDDDKRSIVVVYLDGKPKKGVKNASTTRKGD